MDDPAGNSFIENPSAPSKDPNMVTSSYHRTVDQDGALGLEPQTTACQDRFDGRDIRALLDGADGASGGDGLERHEVIRMPEPCPSCRVQGEALTVRARYDTTRYDINCVGKVKLE